MIRRIASLGTFVHGSGFGCSTSALGFGGLPLVAVCLALGVATPARAQPPSGWLPASWFTAGQIDPQAMFPLAEKDGPWLVLATTFRGEQARQDARRLVQELRGQQRLAAYTHEKAFDYTGRQRGAGFNPDGSPKTMRYAKSSQVIEVAVLVGDFASCDDPRAQKALQRVKSLRPEALANASDKGKLVTEFLSANRQHANAAGGKGPLQGAMLIPNPLLPEDYFSRQQVDDFVLQMNADVAHSLLDCPTRYSVRVATFSGAGTFEQAAAGTAPTGGLVDVDRFMAALRGSGWQDPKVRSVPLESRLVEAADKAHRLTEALRRAGWQAWEFHDRESSLVCVGSIDALAVPDATGRPTTHPEIARIVAGLGPDPQAAARGQVLPRSFDGIMLDLQPKPIDVPRAPTKRR